MPKSTHTSFTLAEYLVIRQALSGWLEDRTEDEKEDSEHGLNVQVKVTHAINVLRG